MLSRSKQWLLLGVVAAVAVGAWLWSSPPAEPLGGFELVDHRRQSFDPSDLSGRWTLVTFGFTSCPDVCPAALTSLAATKRLVEQRGAPPPQVVFVSVDSNRDTPAVLAEYVPHFDSAFLGVTGQPAQIRRLERQLGATHTIHPPKGADPNVYNVDHSAAVYVIDPERRPVARLEPPLRPAEAAERLHRLQEGQG